MSNIRWLAGLLEGEGYFTTFRKRPGPGVGHGMGTVIGVGMTDRDVIEKYADVLQTELGVKTNVRHQPGKTNRKDMWVVRTENKEDVVKLGLAVFVHMGERRKQAIANQLEWNALRRELPHGNTGRKNPCKDGCTCSRHNKTRSATGQFVLAGV